MHTYQYCTQRFHIIFTYTLHVDMKREQALKEQALKEQMDKMAAQLREAQLLNEQYKKDLEAKEQGEVRNEV